jgi:hypothetical protein
VEFSDQSTGRLQVGHLTVVAIDDAGQTMSSR